MVTRLPSKLLRQHSKRRSRRFDSFMLLMRQTRARKTFKECFGQNNHYLITTLVGLDYIKNNEVACPETFSTSWNPRNRSFSVLRSRNFVLSSFLSSAVDGIDLYLNCLCDEPKVIQDSSYYEKYEDLKFISAKFSMVSEYFDTDDLSNSLCRLLITIRNIHVHNGANNNISQEDRMCLLSNREKIKEKYCGCDIDTLIEKISSKESVTFKEVASLINATHHFVQEVDEKIIEQIDKDNEHRYYCNALLYILSKNNGSKDKYLRMQGSEKDRFIKNILCNKLGLSIEDINYLDIRKLNQFRNCNIEFHLTIASTG